MDTKKIIKKTLVTSGIILSVLTLVLCVHIYMVTRPKPIDPKVLAMARIDIKQAIGQQDADIIYNWLSTQKGVQHVTCNLQSNIVLFSYAPALANADVISKNFKTALNYKADRFMPSAEQLKGGCPAMGKSVTYSMYTFFKHIF